MSNINMAKIPLYSASQMPEDAKQQLYREIEQWDGVCKSLSKLIDTEREMRTYIFNKYFLGSTALEEGTNHIALDYGKQLTADYRISRKVDEGELDAALAARKFTSTLADEVINYKPFVRIGVWKELDPATKQLFADIVEEKPTLPGIRLTDVKK